MYRWAVVLCAALLGWAPGSRARSAVVAEDPLAPAWAGQVQCYVPDVRRRECKSIGAYERVGSRAVLNQATVLVSSTPPVVVTTVAPVWIKEGRVCGLMGQDDIWRSAFSVSGAAATAEQEAALKRQMVLAMQPLFGKEVCTVVTKGAGKSIGRAWVDGVRRPQMDQPVLWVPKSAGYKVPGGLSRDAPSYAERNGEAEARRDLEGGGLPRLYRHRHNARVPTMRIPGLLSCEPGGVAWGEPAIIFMPLPEADWSEGLLYTAEQSRNAEAARRFASQYNRTMLQAFKEQLDRACPNARLTE